MRVWPPTAVRAPPDSPCACTAASEQAHPKRILDDNPSNPSSRIARAPCRRCAWLPCAGECINCMDKSKFGGQGVRKQSCINRRCIRMNSSSGGGSSNSSSGPGIERADGKSGSGQGGDPEQAIFWAAVSGVMALNGAANGVGSDDDSSATMRHPGSLSRDSGSSSPRSPTFAEYDSDNPLGYPRRERDAYEPPRGLVSGTPSAALLPGSSMTGSDSFCNKLASVLVRRLDTCRPRPSLACLRTGARARVARRRAAARSPSRAGYAPFPRIAHGPPGLPLRAHRATSLVPFD